MCKGVSLFSSSNRYVTVSRHDLNIPMRGFLLVHTLVRLLWTLFFRPHLRPSELSFSKNSAKLIQQKSPTLDILSSSSFSQLLTPDQAPLINSVFPSPGLLTINPQILLYYIYNTNKNANKIFVDREKLILKFIFKNKRTRIAEIILKIIKFKDPH